MTQTRLLLIGACAVIAAAAGGYGVARLTSPRFQPAAAEDHHPSEEALIKLNARQIAASDITLETVAAGSTSGEIVAAAVVAPSPDGEAVLTAHAPGAVLRILKRIGDPVSRGETVAVVESREAAQIAADRSAALARATLAIRRLERERALFEQKVSPRQDLETAEAESAAAQAEVRRARAAAGVARLSADGRSVLVVSPIAGQINSAKAALGDYVQAETELFRVANPKRVQVEAQVTAADSRRLTPGGRAVIEAADGRSLAAAVASVTPALGAETRSATVLLTTAGQGLAPGESLRVRLSVNGGGGAGVTVAEEAVQRVNGRDVVFVNTSEGFKAQTVVLGERSAGRVSVVQGLAAGQAVASRNAFLLKAELAKGEGEEH